MGCSSPVTVSKQVPPYTQAPSYTPPTQAPSYTPPPEPPGMPSVILQYYMPANPAYFRYDMSGTVYVPEVEGATYYLGNLQINGQTPYGYPVRILKEAIPSQIGHISGYWQFNILTCKPGQSVVISAQACNNAGCSSPGPALSIPSAAPGSYGPTVGPTHPPGQPGLVRPSTGPGISGFCVEWDPVSGADTYVLKDMAYNPPYGYNLITTSGTSACLPQSLLNSLYPGGVKSGYNILLAVQACNARGCGPIGPSNVIPFSTWLG